MSLKVLQAGVAAFGQWRDRLSDSDYHEEMRHKIVEADKAMMADRSAARRQPASSTWFLYHDTGEAGRYAWSFSVTYSISREREKRDLSVEWTFDHPSGKGGSLRVVGTGLSDADEVAQSFRDDLATDKQTGELYVRSLRLPFSEMVRMPRLVLRRLGPYLSPLIMISSETRADEILAQLCVHALRTDLFNDQGEILRALERWLAGLVPTHPEIVGEAAAGVVSHWLRPRSSRSFRDYCRRTAVGLAKDHLNAELPQRRLAGERAGRIADNAEVMAVDELVLQGGVPKSTAYRWLREGRIRGDIAESRTQATTVLGITVTRKHRRYQISRDGVADARRLLRERHIRRALVDFLVDLRKITPRAARAWVRRRIQKGLTLEQIAEEARSKYATSDSSQ